MENLNMIHLPRSESVSYQAVSTDGDYSAKSIHMHDTHEINLILSSSRCIIQCNGGRCTVEAPALLFHRRGTYHAILSAGGAFDSRVIYFDPDSARDVGKRFLGGELFSHDFSALPLSEKQAEDFLPLFRLVEKEEGICRFLAVLTLLAKAASLSDHVAGVVIPHTKNAYIFSVLSYVRDHLGEDLTIEALSLRFHVSPTKLKGDFRRITGSTVKQYVLESRLRLACNLLEQKSDSLSQIALSCGFSGESHLIRQFRRQFGATPGAWRKNHP